MYAKLAQASFLRRFAVIHRQRTSHDLPDPTRLWRQFGLRQEAGWRGCAELPYAGRLAG